ncbi:MAG: GDP-L-fucose synthase [Ruminococcus flavefaciens]|nr:GDP-L-fucose synthase [Ruminococcus flavefaciens]
MEQESKIYIAGHRGMVGSAIMRCFKSHGFNNIIGKTSKELDLRIQADVNDFFEGERPDYVILAAAKVGGIMANIESPAEFLYDNLAIQNNVINCSYKYGVKKLLFLASSCIYPRLAPQPMKEEYLLDGKVEPTNEGYAIAKIAGLKLCEMYNRQYATDYISVMPCNLYGIGDNFNPAHSHVVPALIRKFHEAKITEADNVIVWGTGNARRELLFSDDLAEACFYLMQNYSGNDFYNVGMGTDVSIKELAEIIRDIIGYEGKIVFDTGKPDGMPQKLMDVSRIKDAGWKYKTELKAGLRITYKWYLDNYDLFNGGSMDE